MRWSPRALAARVRLPPAWARVASMSRRLNSETAPWKPTTGLGAGGGAVAAGGANPRAEIPSRPLAKALTDTMQSQAECHDEAHANSARYAYGDARPARPRRHPPATAARTTGQTAYTHGR